MKWLKWFAAAMAYLALLVGAVYCDLWLLTVGGFVEIVDGIKADPTNGSDILWGIVKVCCSGIGMFVAVMLAAALTAALTGKSRRRLRSKVRF